MSNLELLTLEDKGEDAKGGQNSKFEEAYQIHALKRDEQIEKSEELCQNVLIILFTILWKGVEGWDDNLWKLRGQVRVKKKLSLNLVVME